MVANLYLLPLATVAGSSNTTPTWGIGGPEFLVLYAGLMIVVDVLTLLWVRRLRDWWPAAPEVTARAVDALLPTQIGMLTDSGLAAGRAAYVELRARGLLDESGYPAPDAARRRRLVKLDPVTEAVYAELTPDRRPRVAQTVATPRVRAALERTRRELEDVGLVLPPRQGATVAGAFVPALAVGALGFVRTVAGDGNGRPTGGILVLTAVQAAVFVALLVMQAKLHLTTAGAAALETLRERHAHLSPALKPAWASYGPGSLALATALFGSAAIVHADPDFAHSVGVYPASSGSFGGGGDGGGGGGCGGGGCGGGGCGG